MGRLGDESGIGGRGTAHERSSERLRSSLLSDFSLVDVLGALDGGQSATALPAGLWAMPLLVRVRTGLVSGGAPVRIPETAVFGLDESDPLEGMWLTTGKGGKVEKHEVDEHDIIVALGMEMDHDHANDPTGLVAVVRQPRGDGTEVRLVTASGLKEALNHRGGGAFAVQRLIRPAQHRSAFKNRTRWRKSAPAEAWIITNGEPVTDTHSGVPGGFLTDTTDEDMFHRTPCSIVHAAGRSGAVAETAAMCASLAEHIEATARPPVCVHELVADFTRSHDGLWYLLQIKAIIGVPVGSGLRPGSPLMSPSSAPGASCYLGVQPPPVERPTVSNTVCCRCCGRRYPPVALSQTLTLRMIRSMRGLQRARGITLSWHRNFTDPSKEEMVLGQSTEKIEDKYGEMRVCSVCYDLYKAEKKLEHAARKFSKRVGVTPDTTEGKADEEWLSAAAKLADSEIQTAGEAGEAAGVEEAAKYAPLELDEREALQGWRLVVVLHEVRGQTDTLELLGLNEPGHSFEFSCMGVQVKIPLEAAAAAAYVSGDNSKSPASPSTISSSPSSTVAPTASEVGHRTVSSVDNQSVEHTVSGSLVEPATGQGRSVLMIRWHRVFPFFCRRDNPATGGMSTVNESIVMENMQSQMPVGVAVPDASSSDSSNGMLNLRTAVHELAEVVLRLRSPKGRKQVIAQGQLPLGHLGVERPPELREHFVSLYVSSGYIRKRFGLSPTKAKRKSGLVLRLAVGLMRAERVGLELLPLRPLPQARSRHTAEDDDSTQLGTSMPSSHVVETELEKLASFWSDVHIIDEETAVDHFRSDQSELSETGVLLRSPNRTSLPAPSSSVLSSVTEQEFVLWWRRKKTGRGRDRRHGAIYVPPPWHCSVDPLPSIWMRTIRSSFRFADDVGAAACEARFKDHGPPAAAAEVAYGSRRTRGSRRRKRGRRRGRKGGDVEGKSRHALAALSENEHGRRDESPKESTGTDPLESENEPAPSFHSKINPAATSIDACRIGELDLEDGAILTSTEDDDELEIESPALSISSQVELAESDDDTDDQNVPLPTGDPISEGDTRVERSENEGNDATGDEPVSTVDSLKVRPRPERRSQNKTSTAKRRTRGRPKGKRNSVQHAKKSAQHLRPYIRLAIASGVPAGTLMYWRVSVAVHGLPTAAPGSPEDTTELILVAEVLGKRLVLKGDDQGKAVQKQQQQEEEQGKGEDNDDDDRQRAANARVGSVVVYGSILELERLLSTPRRGALRGASAACGELRLTLCARFQDDSTEEFSYGDSLLGTVRTEEGGNGDNLLHGPWEASTIGNDTSSISSNSSNAPRHACQGGNEANTRGESNIVIVGGGRVDLGTLISSGGELLRSVIIDGGTESGKLQVGVWCDPVHAPPPNIRPARPIEVRLHI